MAERVPIRVALDEAAFRDLVAGKVVRTVAHGSGILPTPTWPVELILSDIGWHRMQAAIDDAEREARDG